MNKFESSFFITRHSKPGSGVEDSPGLSAEGVELAQEKGKIIAELIADAKPGSIVLFGGVTSSARTRSTMEIYGNEVERISKESNGDSVRFINTEEIKELTGESGYSAAAEKLVSDINLSPEQKVVIELPLFLKEFSMENYLFEDDGKTIKPEWQQLLEKYGKNHSEAVKEWFDNPEISRSVNPQETAQGLMVGMKRLADFSKRFFPDRPVTIGFVGHSFFIDSLLTYLANGGNVTSEGFEKIGGKIIEETELSTIEFDESNNLQLHYRGETFTLPVTENNITH